ncbi:hypothetical protein SOPP22_11970 [Shewanella sp. OPT22]|nr:hypothetical protein SOPP22_11970 [Shewanella sp. OPT22]
MSQFAVLDAFKKELWDLENHWFLFIDLYGNKHREKRRSVLLPSHPLLFDVIKLRLHDHAQLIISRLLDPAKTYGKDNLSLKTLIATYSPFSDEVQTKIDDALTEIQTNFANIKQHRNKRISHNDLNNKLDYDLPAVKITEIDLVIDKLELIFNLISVDKRNRNHEFFPRNIDEEFKAEHLLKILEAGRETLGLSTS